MYLKLILHKLWKIQNYYAIEWKLIKLFENTYINI